MQWRATLAIWIAVLLLSVSCSASACELSCDLMARGSGCHHAAGATEVAATHCGELAKPGSDSITTLHRCKHVVCKTLPPAIAGDRIEGAPERIDAQQAVTAALVVVVPLHVSSAEHFAEAPPLRAPLLVCLQTTLRV
jgi:hypothetical protein